MTVVEREMRIVDANSKADAVPSRAPRLAVLLAGAVLACSLALVGSAAPSAPAATQVAAGGLHTCALMSGGGVKCWGSNLWGPLGNGTASNSSRPVDVVGLASGGTAIAAGHKDYSCAATGTGVKCWGNNQYGQLGNGSRSPQARTPVDVVGLGSGVRAIAAGFGHVCALTGGGGVKCWGENGYGGLGNGTQTASTTPVDVIGLSSGVRAITAGANHSCALTSSGGVKCWGGNYNGELGNGGSSLISRSPVDVVGLTSGVVAISSYFEHACALTSGGGVECWGINGKGQLGNGTQTASKTPVGVDGLSSGVRAIAAGYSHTCALTSSGGVKCWGDNLYGALGNGSTTSSSPTPVAVSGLSRGVTAIAAGQYHTCAVTSDGGVKCWGQDDFGQLGNGATGCGGFNRCSTPVAVLFSATPGANAAPKLTVGGASTQRLFPQQGVTVTGRCDKPCSLSATGSVRILGTKYTFGLARVTVPLAAGTRTLTLRFRAVEQRRFRQLLKPGQRARAVITVRATAKAGNAVSSKRVVVALAPSAASIPAASTGASGTGKLLAFVDRIESVLAQSAAGRRQLAAALSAGFNCSIAPRAAGERVAGVVDNRQSLLGQLGNLETPNQRAGEALGLLRLALRHSIDADVRYRDGFLGIATRACPLPSNASFKLAARSDVLATTAKQRFTAVFNRLARSVNRRTWSATEI
jgi:alpha-tubulin suppressor-like RCC1 family protein